MAGNWGIWVAEKMEYIKDEVHRYGEWRCVYRDIRDNQMVYIRDCASN